MQGAEAFHEVFISFSCVPPGIYGQQLLQSSKNLRMKVIKGRCSNVLFMTCLGGEGDGGWGASPPGAGGRGRSREQRKGNAAVATLAPASPALAAPQPRDSGDKNPYPIVSVEPHETVRNP